MKISSDKILWESKDLEEICVTHPWNNHRLSSLHNKYKLIPYMFRDRYNCDGSQRTQRSLTLPTTLHAPAFSLYVFSPLNFCLFSSRILNAKGSIRKLFLLPRPNCFIIHTIIHKIFDNAVTSSLRTIPCPDWLHS